MSRSGFTTIELIIVVAIIGIIALMGFPKIRRTLDKTNVRSARAAVSTLAVTARAAAIQRGCPAVVHFVATNATVWGATNCVAKGDTGSRGQQLGSPFTVSMAAARDS